MTVGMLRREESPGLNEAATAPLRIRASTPPTPIASGVISTCPSAGLRSGRSMTASPSGPPNAWIATAFNACSSLGDVGDANRRSVLLS